ncbi:LOW QUALITY PROTEIN: wall-associated receptor kinase-like 1 [Impatiens glandulifera]|uniref:LOW QUALITY PROTEIN: wall-associated receptor kinase-like 1 n=1 Tax=Impatiens glandulifera TaxID=253017 RepID=UPI001FB17FE4|nr:LOW QUALITY PROTEIN: wall-associated receptor kinase-like 1 [Impatiens glandulifera]
MIMKFQIRNYQVVLSFLSWMLLVATAAASYDNLGQIAKPGCPDKCGDIDVPFPFGIGVGSNGTNCCLDDRYNLTCSGNTTDYNSTLTWPKYSLDVVSINLPGNYLVARNPALDLQKCNSDTSYSEDLSQSPIYLDSNATFLWYVLNRTEESLGLSTSHYGSGSQSTYYCERFISSGIFYMRCSCRSGYTGNPYIPFGCRVVCELNPQHSSCNIKPKEKMKMIFLKMFNLYYGRVLSIFLGVCTGIVGLLLLLVVTFWLYKVIKKRYETKQKEKFFQNNGGYRVLLQQHLMSSNNEVHKAKLFESRELEKATDHFHEDRILGKGGQGTVYKGMLSDGRIVAVKKSKDFDKSNVEQFINEVIILSQINHRNVVKLIGCCLETEFPLLVYEFISNGTLFHHIHSPTDDFRLSWGVRLRIACEIAGALSYLHSSAAMPIYHRDVKSTNILLDDKYKAKLADFGTSKSITIDQTHLTTVVQGTFGYLDPEYFQSSQFTDKSDVYSFGVVIVELLTSQKPISSTRSDMKSLTTYFIQSIDNNQLVEILDPQILEEGCIDKMVAVAQLARRCLNLNGRKRPTMKEVSLELEGIEMSQRTDKTQQNQQQEIQFITLDLQDSYDETSTFTGTYVGSTSTYSSTFERLKN